MAIEQTEYLERRQRLMKQVGDKSIVIIPAAKESIRSGDANYLFRQNSDFYYLTGFPEPDAIAVLVPGFEPGPYLLFCHDHDPKVERWEGRRAGHSGARDQYLANEAYDIESFKEMLLDLLKERKQVYFPVGQHDKFDKRIFKAIRKLKRRSRNGVVVPQEYFSTDPVISELRLFKSESEIDLMRCAAEISAKAHCDAMKMCKPGAFEYQLEACLHHEFTNQGSRAPAYTTIVGGGGNSCILHYVDNKSELKSGDLVLIDAGCEYEMYASDVTRTFPVNGTFTKDQKAIYNIVLDAQLAGIKAVKPGRPWGDLQKIMLDIIVKGLVELKILNGNVHQLIQDKDYMPFYMHNSGHWLGLDVHDVGVYKKENEWRLLEEGMVLTVEPGIYIAEEIKDVDARWKNIGVRIEDDVLVTKGGCEVLSSQVPKTISEIEALMKNAE